VATVIKLKRGTSTPTTSNIASGEVAVDTSAKKFYINDAGTIKKIGEGLQFESSIKTADFTAVSDTGYFVDTSSNVLTVTLPASPSVGDQVHVIDVSNSAATNNITIDRNSNPIASSAANLTVAVNGAAFRLIWSGSSTFGWVLMDK